MRTGRFGPVVTAMITPMHANGAVNFQEAKRLAQWLCEHGSTGLVVCGTTGEGPTLTDDEKVRLFGTVVDAVGAYASVIANTGGNDTRTSVELTRRACAAGAHAILAVGPYYNKPPQAGLASHFTAMADASEVPVMIYNIPGRTAVNVLPETLARLAAHPRIRAVKESSGDLMQIAEVVARVSGDFDVYAGDDHLALPTAAIGGCGVVSVASHVAGPQIRAMLDAFARGDNDAACELHVKLLPLVRALFAVTSPIPVKAAMRRFGFDAGSCRSPLCELTGDQERALAAAVAPWAAIETKPTATV
ncbi:MAG TPA: 4-hydroxy-tetrahydrodipicolinate synthase [Candidatus Eremiobacteraceae bacterium]|nr:4-hydroxy-tetrahydrodipicolinate synthase [Candidatus Eremiobacteraceae bacterium]